MVDCINIFMALCMWLNPAPAPTVQETIIAAAQEFGVSPSTMLRVAFCESTFRTWVYGDQGRALGLFQFHLPTWLANAKRLGYTTDMRDDPVASSRVAAEMFSRGQQGQWTCG